MCISSGCWYQYQHVQHQRIKCWPDTCFFAPKISSSPDGVRSIIPWMGAYHVEIDVIQYTWYRSSYQVRADLHIVHCKPMENIWNVIDYDFSIINFYFYKPWVFVYQKPSFVTNHNKNRVLWVNVDYWSTLTKAGEYSLWAVNTNGPLLTLCEQRIGFQLNLWVNKEKYGSARTLGHRISQK